VIPGYMNALEVGGRSEREILARIATVKAGVRPGRTLRWRASWKKSGCFGDPDELKTEKALKAPARLRRTAVLCTAYLPYIQAPADCPLNGADPSGTYGGGI
jgi:hypothetical protein